MLPSCGHFKNIPCPFYKLALCVRPHCPYKHQNSENGHSRQVFLPLVDEQESLLDSNLNKLSYHDTASEISATYIPTPVDGCSKPPGILKTSSNSERPSTSFVPEYKPTPISRLNVVSSSVLNVKSSKSRYSPEFPVTVRKKKNVEEYDPTEVKCVSKKTVTFVDHAETSSGDDVPIILISSDEDDVDAESAPKFSDDDYEDETPTVPNTTKQVPEITVIKEEVIDEEKIDEFSVVDKILGDCKKNEVLLNSYKKLKLVQKANSLSTNVTTVQKQDKNKAVLSQKSETKSNTNFDSISIKIEKDDGDDGVTNVSKLKKSDNIKKDSKTGKSGSCDKVKKVSNSHSSNTSESSDKIKKVSTSHSSNAGESSNKIKKVSTSHSHNAGESSNKIKKVSTSHSSNAGESSNKIKKVSTSHSSNAGESSDKIKKIGTSHSLNASDSSNKIKNVSTSHSSSSKEKSSHSKESDKLKHSKKIPHEPKTSSSSDHKGSDSLDKIKHKKRAEKKVDSDNSYSNKKKMKFDIVYSGKSSESNIKPKEKSTHPVKRKSDVSDSDSEQHSSKHKSSSDAKKLKSASPPKRTKSIDSVSSDRTNPENNSSSDVDEALLSDLLSSSESDDPDEECRRIFNEFYGENSESSKKDDNEESSSKSFEPTELKILRQKPFAQKKPFAAELQESSAPKSSETADAILRRKRMAHPAAAELKLPAKLAKPEIKRPLNPAQVMHDRFVQFHAKFSQLNKNKDGAKGTDKKRLNFNPSQSLLDAVAVKNKNQNNPSLENFSPLPPTVSQSFKSTKRTAHIPETSMKPRPIIPSEYGSKVPANIRQKYLNAFIDECLKFCPSEDEAYDTAIEEEKKVYSRSSSRSLYLNVAANALHRLRRQAEEGPKSSGSSSVPAKSNASKSDTRTVSHETMLNGPLAQRMSFSIGRKKEVREIRGGTELYEYLLTYVMTLEQLTENSYPLPDPVEKDKAIIAGAYANRTLYCNDAFKRTCSRCHKTYYVNVEGDYVREEECDFHWGRIWRRRIAGNFESRYSCCQGDAESDGCCVSAGHVFDGSEAHVLRGYVKTLPKSPPADNYYGIYALDCEMCYTTAGMELTRITVVDTDLKPVFESFVKPQHKVLDYNTRFSGITEDDLKNVRTSIQDVQAVLLCIFNDKSILIGHSLESDFKALKLFHTTVVDTSVVFPHKNGLPYKRALRTLMAEKLNKIIQNDVGGHDSLEDATACMELMLWKVKEDARSNR